MNRRFRAVLMLAAAIPAACPTAGWARAPGEAGDAAPVASAPAPATLPVAPEAPRPADARVLNVGDVIQVLLPGEDGFQKPFRLDRDGRVELPEAGTVSLAGLTVAEARDRIREALSGYIRDLQRMDLVLREHRLLVTVLGYVRTPGTVDLPATANVQQAILAAGGLADGAQINDLRLRRDGKETHFDYKKYLDSGDGALLPAMHPLDEIFVPASPQLGNVQRPFDPRNYDGGDAGEGKQAVGVFGEVNHPGSFAMKDGMTVMDALARAGGVTRYAGSEQIRIIAADGSPRVFNLKGFLDTGNKALNVVLDKGATVFVPAQTDEVKAGKRVVYVMGEVARPGAMDMREGATFFDILASTGGPTRFADTRQVRIIRSGTEKVDLFDLSAFTNGKGGAVPQVHGGDAVFVPEKQGGELDTVSAWLRTPPEKAVKVMGAVRNPGRLQWSDENSIIDLLAQVNGTTERADLGHVQILASDGSKVDYDLQKFLDKGGSLASLPRIHGGATVVVPETPSSPTDMRSTWLKQPADQSIYVMGSVGNPGRFAFDPKLSFLDILTAANGPNQAADIVNIRVTHRGEARDRVSKVNLAQYFESGDETLLPHVRPGDVIYVPDHNRSWLEQSAASTIRVLGAVGKPGRYQFSNGMTILDLLAEAGGPAGNALQSRIVVVNLSAYGTDQARTFDLPKFARTGDYRSLPLVRAGDTVYVPSLEQSDWNQFLDGLRDVSSALTIIALMKAL